MNEEVITSSCFPCIFRAKTICSAWRCLAKDSVNLIHKKCQLFL